MPRLRRRPPNSVECAAFGQRETESTMTSDTKNSRQELIVRTAAEIVAEAGLERVTFREIAAKCGVSKGVVEHHFTDKNDILRKTLDWVNLRFVQREQRRTAKKNGLEALHARLSCLLPLTAESVMEWKVRLHFWSMAVASADDKIGMSVRLAGARERFRTDVEAAIAAGEVPASVDPLQAANMVLHLVAGVACNMLVDPTYYHKSYRARVADKIVDDLRRGCI
jgi:AcrR family transcriptional regulator